MLRRVSHVISCLVPLACLSPSPVVCAATVACRHGGDGDGPRRGRSWRRPTALPGAPASGPEDRRVLWHLFSIRVSSPWCYDQVRPMDLCPYGGPQMGPSERMA